MEAIDPAVPPIPNSTEEDNADFAGKYAKQPDESLAARWASLCEERNRVASKILESRIANGEYETYVMVKGEPFSPPATPKYWSVTMVQEQDLQGTTTVRVAMLDPRSTRETGDLLDEQMWLEGELAARGALALLR